RLNIARPRSAYCPLNLMENQNPGGHRNATGFHSVKAFRIARKKQRNADRTPQPAIAAAGGEQHPHADPAWRTPAIHAAHETVVRHGKSFPGSRDCHNFTAPRESAVPSASMLPESEACL